MKSGSIARRMGQASSICIAMLLFSCQVQWVSPYSADLQKKATDMLSDVVAWDAHMRVVAGTAAADPRNPDVEAKLETWRGDIEAMSEIELSIDPGSAACDKFLSTISGLTANTLRQTFSSAPALSGGSGDGLTAPKVPTHCETLPQIFTRMMKQVAGSETGSGPVTAGIPVELAEQCKLPWLSDEYFDTLREGRATAGAQSPARAPAAGAKAGTPAPGQADTVKAGCRSLFEPPAGSVHGNAVASLVTDLDAIIYREGREAPLSSK